MPQPVSATSMTHFAPDARVRTAISSPGAVYFNALSSTIPSSCRSLSASASTAWPNAVSTASRLSCAEAKSS